MDEAMFLERGFDVVPVEDMGKLVGLRENIFQKAKEIVAYEGDDADYFFNNFHKHNLKGADLNEKRMEIINHCTKNLNVGKTIYEMFPNLITKLVGPDIIAQKTTNLVIQQPGDQNAEALHRDSPANSPFEITVWVPLVNVYGTKSMYVLPLPKSQEALALMKKDYEAFTLFAKLHAQSIEVPFGKALFFWQGLIHGVPVNCEQETRWSLNMRYKNIFSPSGTKGLIEFFDLLHLSPLTRIAFDYEREAYAKRASETEAYAEKEAYSENEGYP